MLRYTLLAAPTLTILALGTIAGGLDLGAWAVALVVAAFLVGGGAVALAARGNSRRIEEAETRADRVASKLLLEARDLTDERAMFETVLAAMEEGVVVVERGGSVVYANASARRILGGGPSRSVTLTSKILRLLSASLESGEVREDIAEMSLPPRTVSARSVPLRDGRVLLVLRDVTAGRRVEAMRRDFVADASHELKTPTASIQAAAETVIRAINDDPEATRRFASQLASDAHRLSRIVSDLLDLSRLESERAVFSHVRLDDVVEEEAARVRTEAEASGVRFSVTAEPVTVEGSHKDLALLVRNLLDNAVRYTPRGGEVRVDVGTANGSARIVVSDTGIGIPSRDLPRVFERFFRVDRARSRETGGTGLGLSIARHVVEEHGGTIAAESELGSGSSFRVELPRAPEGADGPADPSAGPSWEGSAGLTR